MLVINDERFNERAEVIWEKGTNRSAFFRGEVDKYSWIDIGSSFLPSDVIAAFLYAQLENLEKIQTRRKKLWTNYKEGLQELQEKGTLKLPYIPEYASVNGHLFYILCNNSEERAQLISFLKKYDIHCVFHYLSLHKSPFYSKYKKSETLINCDGFSDRLLRLPLYYELDIQDQNTIIALIKKYFKENS